MGRYYYSKKEEADDLKKVEIWWLRRHGYLSPGIWHKPGGIEWTFRSGDKHSISLASCTVREDDRFPHVWLNYTQTDRSTGEKKEFDYKVPLTQTPCKFGGHRWWFICPLTKNGKPCGRRVAVLYKSGDWFGCRHCHELSYESRNQNRRYKMMPLFEILRAEKKIEDIAQTMKRRFYRGKPTRKLRRIHRLNRKAADYEPFLNRML